MREESWGSSKDRTNQTMIHLHYLLISFPKVSFAFPQDSVPNVKVSFSKKEEKRGQFLCYSVCFSF